MFLTQEPFLSVSPTRACTVVGTLQNCVASTEQTVISSSCFILLCLSQKVPSNGRYLWTQLSSADSTSVDTDIEQYEPSNDPSVTLSTFRSELPSFFFSCVLCVSQPLLSRCVAAFCGWTALHSVCVCSVCILLRWIFTGWLNNASLCIQTLRGTEQTWNPWFSAASLRKVSPCKFAEVSHRCCVLQRLNASFH